MSTPPTHDPIPLAPQRDRSCWVKAARMLANGVPKRRVRLEMGMTISQWDYMRGHPAFKQMLSEVGAEMMDLSIARSVEREFKPLEILSELAEQALAHAEEALNSGDDKRRDRFALKVLDLAIGKKERLEHSGGIEVSLPPETCEAIQQALEDIADGPLKQPNENPESEAGGSSREGKGTDSLPSPSE